MRRITVALRDKEEKKENRKRYRRIPPFAWCCCCCLLFSWSLVAASVTLFIVFVRMPVDTCQENVCDGFLWIATGTNISTYHIATQTLTDLGGTDPDVMSMTDIAWQPDDGLLWTIAPGFIQLQTLNVSNTPISSQPEFDLIDPSNAIEFSCDGFLYAAGSNKLYRIDVMNQSFTLVSDQLINSAGDIAITFMGGALYHAGFTMLEKVDLQTGNTTPLGTLPTPLLGLGACNGILYGGDGTGRLYTIQINPFLVTQIDDLGINIRGMSIRIP